MVPNDFHFGHARLPRSGHLNFLVPGQNTDTSGFSVLGIEDKFGEVLKKMNVTRPADIQVNIWLMTFSLEFFLCTM